jgi:NifB/MoaA-like Fe-S oxidoreductase
MRPHTVAEAGAVVDTVAEWQPAFVEAVGRRLVFAADEYYLLARLPFPGAPSYEGFPQHENGIGIVRAFERAFSGAGAAIGVKAGFFSSVDGAPAEGYRAPRVTPSGATPDDAAGAPTAIVTGEYGAAVLGPLVDDLGRRDIRIVTVRNEFFGGNIAVAGLMTGEDVARALAAEPKRHRYLLPDVCLTQGRFLDGTVPADLPRPVQIVPTDGRSLRRALDGLPGSPLQGKGDQP